MKKFLTTAPVVAAIFYSNSWNPDRMEPLFP
jgi:hypothetical protein